MISTSWKDEQHPSLIQFISSFLAANSYRLNFLPIDPVILTLFIYFYDWCEILRLQTVNYLFQDFIVNNGGLSVAFNFVTSWDSHKISQIFSRCLVSHTCSVTTRCCVTFLFLSLLLYIRLKFDFYETESIKLRNSLRISTLLFVSPQRSRMIHSIALISSMYFIKRTLSYIY